MSYGVDWECSQDVYDGEKLTMTKDVLKRYQDFWNREEMNRPVLHITVPQYLDTMEWESIQPKSMEEEWEDIEARYRVFKYKMDNSLYFGEGFPTERAFFGSVCLAAMLGSDYRYAPYTVWFGLQEPIIKDWRDFESATINRNSTLFSLIQKIYETFGKRLDGQYRLGMTDLGGNFDILAPLRGTENLLLDLMDQPDELFWVIEKTDKLFEEAFEFYYQIFLSHGQQGMSSWQGIWCDKRYFPLQCDFAAMISPDDFAKFVIPSLKRAAAFLDHSIFHLDGPAMIPHLEHLLALEDLDGIQWVPGDGNPPAWDEKWFPLYDKIQTAGKNLVLLDVNHADHILNLCNNFSSRGMFISANLEDEEDAIKVLGNW